MTLTHLGPDGRPRMVDVGGKDETVREAVAEGYVLMSYDSLERVTSGSAKGDVRQVATLAGIMGAKRTADLVPLCHPLPLSAVEVEIEPASDGTGLRIVAKVRTTGRTGVEMEAMTAVTVAALTVYDMLKSAERGIEIGPVRLLKKSGGKSGDWSNERA